MDTPSPPDDLDLGQTVRGFSPGQKLFGRYTLKAVLGRGGMGIVWRAWDEQLERDVALKFLPELVIHDRAVLDDLKRETRRSLELTHHNIVRIHDFAQDSQSACISMEYVDGNTLSGLRIDKPCKVFEPDELLPLIEQTCEALTYAHSRARIVHCDLKPANLMLNAKGELKVTDFGISRSLSDSVSAATMGGRGTSGTLPYMSPQQLDGDQVSHLDDIYSLGATIYDLLTSKPPFFRGDVARQVHDKVPPLMGERRQELGIASDVHIAAQWERAVATCLAKDPTARPQSASEVLALLRAAVPSRPPKPAGSSHQPLTTVFDQPGFAGIKKVYIAIAGLAVAAVVGTWLLLSQAKSPEEKPLPSANGLIVDSSPARATVAAAPGKTHTPEQVAAESKRVNEFFDKNFDDYVARHPQFASQLGLKIGYDKWEDLSDESNAEDLAVSVQNLAKLKRDFDFAALDPQTQLSWKLFEKDVQQNEEGFRFRFHNYPVNQMFGWHSQTPTFLINIHRVDSVSDAGAYIARLNGVAKQADQVIANLELRAEKGIVPPKFVFPLVLDACRNVIKGKPFETTGTDSTLLADFTKKVTALKDVDQPTRDRLLAEANKALLESFQPAYQKLIAFLEAQEKTAPTEGGAWQFPDGRAYYEFALRRTTTTNLTGDEIHNLGLKEIARIHGEMGQIKEKVKFKGDLQAMFKFMREDPQFYLPETEEGKAEYLSRAVKVIDTMKTRLDELFITKPKADIVVKAVEKFREKSAGKAFYQQPAPDGSRPGMFYVNLAEMKSTPIYELEALAYHEGIPGHHMQIAIAQELTGVPKFRRMGSRYTAYSEGWGLYTELVPKEIGLYQDPYSDFGRLAMELWRAARLVVDTGLHHKRWTRQQAIDYLIKNTPNAENDCVEAINRYIVSPSQATAYKIGMIKILELREKAKKQLGPKFDLRQFHDVVLTNGPVPLETLEELVDKWVKGKS